jgi:transposase
MRKLKDVLRLKLNADQSHQQIATALGIAKGSVTKYCSLAAAAGLDWGAVQAMSETDLEQRLFGSCVLATYARPDYGRIHQELRRKGVTVMLLWQEYSAQVGDEHCAENPVKALRYSQFSENYRQFARRLKRSMRQSHRAGEKMFIDYAGPTVPLIEHGLEVGRANIFVATMAASGYSFALATPRQTAADWLHGTACALTFFGGTPQLSRARDNCGNQQDRIM